MSDYTGALISVGVLGGFVAGMIANDALNRTIIPMFDGEPLSELNCGNGISEYTLRLNPGNEFKMGNRRIKVIGENRFSMNDDVAVDEVMFTEHRVDYDLKAEPAEGEGKTELTVSRVKGCETGK